MKKILLVLLFAAMAAMGTKISEGVYTVGTGKTYATLKAAMDSVATTGNTGDLIFECTMPFDITTWFSIRPFNGYNTYIVQMNPTYGNPSSTNYINCKSDNHLFNLSGANGPGKLIVENVTVKYTVAAGSSRLVYITGCTGEPTVVFRNCDFRGAGNCFMGVQEGGNVTSTVINDCIFSGFTYGGLYTGGGHLASQYAYFNNLTIMNSVRNFYGYATLTPQMAKNIHSFGGTTGDYVNLTYTHGSNCVSGDTSATGFGLGSGFNSQNNQASQTVTDWMDTAVADTTLYLYPIKKGQGVYPDNMWSCRYINGVPHTIHATDIGAKGVLRKKTRPQFRCDTIIWPAPASQIAKVKYSAALTAKYPSGVKCLVTNTNYDTVPSSLFGADTIMISSPVIPMYKDTFFVFYDDSITYKKTINATLAESNFYYGLDIRQSTPSWNFGNLRQADMVIDTSLPQECWGGFQYSLDKKRAYISYREAKSGHGYDSSGQLKFVSYNVDDSGRLTTVKIAKKTIFNIPRLDERSTDTYVQSIGGLETIISAFDILDSGSGGFARLGQYIVWSTDSGNTWTDSVCISNGKATSGKTHCQKSHVSGDLLYSGYTLRNLPGKICSVYVHRCPNPADTHQLRIWNISLLHASSDSSCPNETAFLELKTDSTYRGKWVAIIRQENTAYTSPAICYSSDDGITWGSLIQSHTFMPYQGGTRGPNCIGRIHNGEWILSMSGGVGPAQGNYVWVSRDELNTFAILPKMAFTQFSTSTFYNTWDEFNDGLLGVVWATNVATSKLFFSYYNVNGQLKAIDSSYGIGYYPTISGGLANIGKSIDGKTGAFQLDRPVYYGRNVPNYYANGYTSPVQILLYAKNIDLTNCGLFKDSTDGTFSLANRIDFKSLADSVKIVQAGTDTGAIYAFDTNLIKYEVQWKYDSLKILKNDSLIISKTASLPNWNGQIQFNFQDDASRLGLQKLFILPLQWHDTIVVADYNDWGNFHIVSDTTVPATKINDTVFWDVNGVSVTLAAGAKWTAIKWVGIGGTAGAPDTIRSGTPGAKDTIDCPKDTHDFVFIRDQVFKKQQYMSQLRGGGNNDSMNYLDFDSVRLTNWWKQDDTVRCKWFKVHSGDSAIFNRPVIVRDSIVYMPGCKPRALTGSRIESTPGFTLTVKLNGFATTPTVYNRSRIRWR